MTAKTLPRIVGMPLPAGRTVASHTAILGHQVAGGPHTHDIAGEIGLGLAHLGRRVRAMTGIALHHDVGHV